MHAVIEGVIIVEPDGTPGERLPFARAKRNTCARGLYGALHYDAGRIDTLERVDAPGLAAGTAASSGQ